jgi:catechol 2,3-dioxygenase-like lactoylglutathione lyase family enzyme
VDLKLEVVVVPVSDVDRAKEFYGSLGFREDIDYVGDDDFRGPDPDRGDYASFATFSDPDGNGWVIQEVKQRAPGR